MAFKVAYGAGHGYNTPGKRSPNNEREWTFNNKVVKAFEKELKKYDVALLRLDDPTGKKDIPLATRTNKANQWGADIYVSIHHNANTGKWGDWGGTETFYYVGSSNGKKLAELVHKATVKAYGLRDRGIKKGNHLWEIRKPKAPAVLVEGGFMDSKIDIEKLRNDKVLEQAGINIAHAVLEYASVKKSTPKKEVTKKESPKKKPSPKNQNKANLKIDGKWGTETTRALQKALGTIVDGIISSQPRNHVTEALYGGVTFSRGSSLVIAALQKKIGAKVDGKLGPDTIRHLQRYLGTPVDGKISRPTSLVVKELQRRLNAGTF